MSKKHYHSKYAITYWLIVFFTNCLQVLTWLPFNVQKKWGKNLGLLLMKRSPKMYHVAYRNIELCFPGLTFDQRNQLIRANFENLGRGVFETLYSAWGKKSELLKMVGALEGFSMIQQAQANGHSIILLFPHMIPMYLAGHLAQIAMQIPIALMYNSPKNKAIDDCFHNRIASHVEAVFNREDTRHMIKYLKQGRKCVLYAPDLDIGHTRYEFVPFFGKTAATLTAPLRLAKLTGAKFFPLGFYRGDDDKYYLRVYPELQNFPSEDTYADLTKINNAMETIIKQKPEQYLWQYKRFSHQPPGSPKVY